MLTATTSLNSNAARRRLGIVSAIVTKVPVNSCLSVAVGLAFWEVATALRWFTPFVLPSPVAVVRDFIIIAQSGYGGASLWASIVISAERVAIGFAGASIAGIVIGCAMGTSQIIRGIVNPIFEFYRPLPAIGYLSLLVIWFGIGETSKIVTLGLAGLPPVVLTTASAVRSVRVERIEGALSLGIRGLALFRYVILPSCVPDILTGLRVGFGFAYGALVAAEMIGASEGLGWVVWNASEYAQSTIVISSIIIIGVTGFLVDLGFKQARNALSPWAGRA